MDFAKISLQELAAFVSSELKKRGIEIILVGGACVTIYSRNRYQSYDLDFVTYEDMHMVTKVMKELGFRTKGKHFEHDGCPWLVEFIPPPIAIGDLPIEHFNQMGTIQMLRPEDSVKDRLASYFHWDDRQGLEQAIDICLEKHIDLGEVEKWAVHEKQKKKFHEFKQKLIDSRHRPK